MYPPNLAEIVSLFESLSDEEKRENLILYADQAPRCAPRPDERFDLEAIYLGPKGVDPKKDTIAYCRIGERSSHTWFVLRYLLGLKDVRNYDGSWTEYGSMIDVPIEREVPQTVGA